MLIEDNNYKSKGKRINWIDEAKGIAILLVIIGHTISKYTYGSLIRGIIFSFHMPLFFILSGMTYKGSLSLPQFKTATKKSIRKLLIPALLIFLILTIYSIWLFPEQLSDLGFYKEKIYTLIYASGVNTHFMDNEIPALGKLWFLFALVIARTLFDYCHLYFSEMQLALVCSIFSALGIILGQIQCLPFSMDIAFAVLPFLYIGYKMKNLKNLNIVGVKIFFITLVIWGITLMLTFPNLSNWTYLELAIRRYPLYPLCFICAYAGSMLVFEFSIWTSKLKIMKPIIYIGKNSIYLFCIHSLDSIWQSLWTIEGRQCYTTALRIIIDLIIFTLFMMVINIYRKVKKS